MDRSSVGVRVCVFINIAPFPFDDKNINKLLRLGKVNVGVKKKLKQISSESIIGGKLNHMYKFKSSNTDDVDGDEDAI